jgi:DNA-binding NtrC family response regulator
MSAKILVVDDEAGVRTLVRACLEGAGYEVSEASSAATLRQALAGPAPEVVVLDLQLADGDGLALLPEIKHHWPQTRVVILTGYGTVDAADQAYAVDDVYMVSKPFDPDMFNAIVGMALSGRPRDPTIQPTHPSSA